jgi:hypothetical protein
MSSLCNKNLAVPFFSQREIEFIWYQYQEGSTEKKNGTDNQPLPGHSLAWAPCNIASLCMILHYFGITNDTPDELLEKVFSSNDTDIRPWRETAQGYNALQYAENMQKIIEKLYPLPGVTIEIKKAGNNVGLAYINEQIKNNYPVWFSFGPLRTGSTEWGTGHIAVIRGFTKEGDVIINDPWGDPTGPYGHLRTDSNRNVKDPLAGYYYTSFRTTISGTGDNCIIRQRDFLKILVGGDQEGGTPHFNQTMVIKVHVNFAHPLKN